MKEKVAALNKATEVITASERRYLEISAQVKLKKKNAYKIRLKMEATEWKAVHSQEITKQ